MIYGQKDCDDALLPVLKPVPEEADETLIRKQLLRLFEFSGLAKEMQFAKPEK